MNDYLILDIETTGREKRDEVIELGIIDMDGNTIYHSLFKLTCPIGERAVEVHGLTLEEVKDAPRFSEEWGKIKELLDGKKVWSYNADFDLRMLNQTARIHYCREVLNKYAVRCVMKGYARYNGKLNPRTRAYKWIKLEQALRNEGVPIPQDHRAIGDCLMTLALIDKVGRTWWSKIL